MTDNINPQMPEHKKRMRGGHGAASGAYGLGLISALVYYIQHAPNFWAGVLGVLKAIIWPALLVYKLLEFLNMLPRLSRKAG